MQPYPTFVDADDIDELGQTFGVQGPVPVIVVASRFDGLTAVADVVTPDGRTCSVRAGLLYTREATIRLLATTRQEEAL